MLRLAWVSDAFPGAGAVPGQGARCRRAACRSCRGSRTGSRWSLAQVSIGDPVVVHPGVYLIHGQVVIDGLVEIRPGVVIAPFVTIGLRAGRRAAAPTIERDVSIGTGAKVIGPVRDRRRAPRSAPTRSSSTTSRPVRRWSARPLVAVASGTVSAACGDSGARTDGDTALAEPSRLDHAGPTRELLARSTQLARRNREQRDRETERRVLRLRHLAGHARADDGARPAPAFAEPDAGARRPGRRLRRVRPRRRHARAAARRRSCATAACSSAA